MLYRPSHPLQLTWFSSYYTSSSLGSDLKYRVLLSRFSCFWSQLCLAFSGALPFKHDEKPPGGSQAYLFILSVTWQIVVVVLSYFWNGSLGFWIWHVSPICLFIFSSLPSSALLASVSLKVTSETAAYCGLSPRLALLFAFLGCQLYRDYN